MTLKQNILQLILLKIFWNKIPCNIKHSNEPIGTKKYFQQVEKRKYFVESHIPKFAQFEKWKNKKVLEIGVGIGTDAINFLKFGADYYGIDISEESIKIAQKRLEIFGFDKDRIQIVNAEEVDQHFPQNQFDLIYSFGVIHHSPNPQKIIDAAYQLIKPGGMLKIMLYAKESWKSYMIEIGLDQPEAQYGCPIALTFTKQEVQSLLKNFDEIEIEQDHIFPYNVEHYKNYRYIKEKWFDSMPEKMFKQLEKKLGWHLLITALKKDSK